MHVLFSQQSDRTVPSVIVKFEPVGSVLGPFQSDLGSSAKLLVDAKIKKCVVRWEQAVDGLFGGLGPVEEFDVFERRQQRA